MSTSSFLGLLFPLGLGGFDPAPALIAAVYLSGGGGSALASRRRGVLLFGLILMGGTAAWGIALTALVGASIAQIPWADIVHLALDAGVWTALGKGLLALGLVAFGVYKLRSKPSPETKNRGLWGLLLVALGFIAIVTADLPFIATVVLAAEQSLWTSTLAFILWSFISQSPLFLLCLAVLLHRDAVFTVWLNRAWSRVAPLVGLTVAVLCLGAGISLGIDALLYPLWGNALPGNFQ